MLGLHLYYSNKMWAVCKYECMCVYVLVCPAMIEATGRFQKLILCLSGQNPPLLQKVEVSG